MIIDTLITDRTQANVDRVAYLAAKWVLVDGVLHWTGTPEELAEWNNGLPGAYGATDWNRVETAVAHLSQILQSLPTELEELCVKNGIHLTDIIALPYDPSEYDLETKTDWTKEDIPRIAEMQRYLNNVVKLRGALNYTTDDLPKQMPNLTIEGANAIERALVGLNKAIDDLVETVERYIDQVVKAFRRTGQFTLWSGSDPLPASVSDKGRTWEELDAMNTTWRNWQVADWYLLLYGNLKAEGDVA